MKNAVAANVEKIYDNFQVLTAKCMVSNIIFAGFVRDMRWLPASLTAVTFAFTSSFASYAASDFTLRWVPEEFKDDPRNYFKEHCYLHGVYFASFFALSLIGSTALTQCTLPLFGRSAPVMKTFLIATLDLIPFYYHDIVSLIPKLEKSP